MCSNNKLNVKQILQIKLQKPSLLSPAHSAVGELGSTKVKLLLNWYPEAEHGGFYAALVHGIYEKHGLDVDILPGGRTSASARQPASARRSITDRVRGATFESATTSARRVARREESCWVRSSRPSVMAMG